MLLDDIDIGDFGIVVMQGYSMPVLPNTSDRFVKIPGRNGAYDFGSNLDVREFVFNCTIVSDTVPQMVDNARLFSKLLVDDFGTPKKLTLVLDDIPDKFFYVKYGGGLDITKIATTGEFTLHLTSVDAFAYSMAELGIPIAVDTPDTTIEFSVGGNINTYPQIHIKGTNSTGSYQITVNGINFTYSGGLLTTDEVIIDCTKFAVYKNGARDMAHFSGTFPHLIPGTNTILYHLNTNATLSDLLIGGYERWTI